MSKSKSKNKEATISFNVGDYLLVKQEEKQYFVSVTKKTDYLCTGINEKYLPYEEVEVPFERHEVICNMGSNPTKMGYEAFYKDFKMHELGTVSFFMKVGSSTRDEVKESLEKGFKELKKRHLVAFFPLNIEIRPDKGKALGHYKLDRKTDIDTLCMRTNADQNFLETFFHECAHGIWGRMIVRRSIKAKWIKSYQEYVNVQKLNSKQLKSMFNELATLKLSIKEFKAQLEDEDEMEMLKEILSYIKKYHRLTVQDIDSIIEDDDFGLLEKVWPIDYLAITKLKDNGITSYSMKSVEEFFSEAFAFYLTGQSIPKDLKKLMEKTLSESTADKLA